MEYLIEMLCGVCGMTDFTVAKMGKGGIIDLPDSKCPHCNSPRSISVSPLDGAEDQEDDDDFDMSSGEGRNI